MEIQEKYLPSVEERQEFLENRISEYKRQIFGSVLECKMAEANGEKRAITVQEDAQKQIINNIDIMQEELDNL